MWAHTTQARPCHWILSACNPREGFNLLLPSYLGSSHSWHATAVGPQSLPPCWPCQDRALL